MNFKFCTDHFWSRFTIFIFILLRLRFIFIFSRCVINSEFCADHLWFGQSGSTAKSVLGALLAHCLVLACVDYLSARDARAHYRGVVRFLPLYSWLCQLCRPPRTSLLLRHATEILLIGITMLLLETSSYHAVILSSRKFTARNNKSENYFYRYCYVVFISIVLYIKIFIYFVCWLYRRKTTI